MMVVGRGGGRVVVHTKKKIILLCEKN